MGFDEPTLGSGSGSGGSSAQVMQPTQGLAAYWAFEDLNTSGAMSSVNSYMAACDNPTDCPTAGPGALGKAAMFDGSGTCMHIPALGTWTSSTLTMSAWVSLSSAQMSGVAPIVTRDADACPSPGIEVNAGQAGFLFMGSNGTHYHAWTPGPAADGWHLLSVRWDGTNEAVFIDGTCACQAAPGQPIKYDGNDYEVEIGCDENISTFTTGGIDEVRVYQRALSDQEMASLYAIGGRAEPTPLPSCPATCTITTAGP